MNIVKYSKEMSSFVERIQEGGMSREMMLAAGRRRDQKRPQKKQEGLWEG